MSIVPLFSKSKYINAFFAVLPSSSLVTVFYLIFSNNIISNYANLSGET